MNETDIRESVLAELSLIAPELDPTRLKAGQPLREQVDLDSFDWLRFLVALHERLEVDIPEADYRKLASVDQLVAYLKLKMA